MEKKNVLQLIKTESAIDHTKIYLFVVLKGLHPGQEVEWDTENDMLTLVPESYTVA